MTSTTDEIPVLQSRLGSLGFARTTRQFGADQSRSLHLGLAWQAANRRHLECSGRLDLLGDTLQTRTAAEEVHLRPCSRLMLSVHGR